MNFYYSGPSKFAKECFEAMKVVESWGYSCVHNWMDITTEWSNQDKKGISIEEQRAYLYGTAYQDLEALSNADFMIIDCGFDTPGQGMWVELGFAQAIGVPVIFYRTDFNMWDPSEGQCVASNLEELKSVIEALELHMGQHQEETEKIITKWSPQNGNSSWE